jgi:hypothetical protein
MNTKSILISILSAGVAISSSAVSLTIDEVIHETPPPDPNLLSGTAEATLSGNILTFLLTNTSLDTGINDAGNLLTGIGFVLPTGIDILMGEALMLSAGDAINFTAPLDLDVSGEWGYDNVVDSGHFMDPATLVVNTSISTMSADTANPFDPIPLFNPPSLNGPEFGLVSALEDSSASGGLRALQDSIQINVTLNSVSAGLLQFIEDNPVILSFGSPDSRGSSVPDDGGTLALLGISGIAILGCRRKRQTH